MFIIPQISMYNIYVLSVPHFKSYSVLLLSLLLKMSFMINWYKTTSIRHTINVRYGYFIQCFCTENYFKRCTIWVNKNDGTRVIVTERFPWAFREQRGLFQVSLTNCLFIILGFHLDRFLFYKRRSPFHLVHSFYSFYHYSHNE